MRSNPLLRVLMSALAVMSLCAVVAGRDPFIHPPHPHLSRDDLPKALHETAVPHRWTWQHWWEANREPYLYELEHRSFGRPPSDALRAQVRDVLVDALKGDDTTRAAAALALGRMGDTEAFDALRHLAENDRSLVVRDHAMLAIGLLDDGNAQHYLRRFVLPPVGRSLHPLHTFDRALLEQSLGPTVNVDNAFERRWVGEAVRAAISVLTVLPRQEPMVHFDNRPEIWKRWDAVLLHHHYQPDNVNVKTMLLAALVYDVIHRRTLSDAPNANVLRPVERRNSDDTMPLIPGGRLVKKPGSENPNIVFAPWVAQWPDDVDIVFARRLGDVYISRIRASAAMMAGDTDDPLLRRALLATLDQQRNDYNRLAQGFAIMALARRPDVDMLPVMLNLVATGDPAGDIPHRSEPLRGYAALALGLYARDEDRPGYERALTVLAERLADRREDEDLRCACAVAIGLSQRDGMLEPLQRISLNTSRYEHRLSGYLILARGMLGDENVVEPARRLFNATASTTLDGTDARRAAILGLGLLGNDEATAALVEAWPDDRMARHEMIHALAMSNPALAGELLGRELARADRGHERAQLIGLLGMLFDYYEPSRLHRLTEGVNYMQWDARIRFQKLANPFLYERLIPAMKGRWW